MKKRIMLDLGSIVGIIVVTLIIFELVSSIAIPPFPKYLLPPCRWGKTFLSKIGFSDTDNPLNSMGFLDKERSFEDSNDHLRILFIGDSFLEHKGHRFVSECEKLLAASADREIECINLGVGAYDPVDYYWILKTVGIRFKPDVVSIFLYEENDFDVTKEELIKRIDPNLLFAIYPQQSIFSKLFPRTTAFLTACRHHIGDYVRDIRRGIHYFQGLKRWNLLSVKEKETRLVSMVSKLGRVSMDRAYAYVRSLDPKTKKFILNDVYGLPMWSIYLLSKSIFYGRLTLRTRKIGAGGIPTADCILEMKKILMENGIEAKINVFFIPSAQNVDPYFVKCYQDLFKLKITPLWIGAPNGTYDLLYSSLHKEGIKVFNLTDVLDGEPGAYDVSGHWSSKGEDLSEEYVASRLSDTIKQ